MESHPLKAVPSGVESHPAEAAVSHSPSAAVQTAGLASRDETREEAGGHERTALERGGPGVGGCARRQMWFFEGGAAAAAGAPQCPALERDLAVSTSRAAACAAWHAINKKANILSGRAVTAVGIGCSLISPLTKALTSSYGVLTMFSVASAFCTSAACVCQSSDHMSALLCVAVVWLALVMSCVTRPRASARLTTAVGSVFWIASWQKRTILARCPQYGCPA